MLLNFERGKQSLRFAIVLVAKTEPKSNQIFEFSILIQKTDVQIHTKSEVGYLWAAASSADLRFSSYAYCVRVVVVLWICVLFLLLSCVCVCVCVCVCGRVSVCVSMRVCGCCVVGLCSVIAIVVGFCLRAGAFCVLCVVWFVCVCVCVCQWGVCVCLCACVCVCVLMHLWAVCFVSLCVFGVCCVVGLCVSEIREDLDAFGTIWEAFGNIWDQLEAFDSIC